MTWSLPISFDLWFAGIAGGVYSTAFLIDYFRNHDSRPLLRVATYLGIPMVLLGVLLLIIDLGNPLRFWHLFGEFKIMSPMSMGTWILLAWLLIAVAMVVLWRIETGASSKLTARMQRIKGFLEVIGLVFAILLMVYTGVLLAVNSNPLWSSTVLLPALFSSSAVSMGLALLVVISLTINAITRGKLPALKPVKEWILGTNHSDIAPRTVSQMVGVNIIAIIIQMVLLVVYVIVLTTSANAGASEAIKQLVSGNMAVPFWLGAVLVAQLIPLVLYIINRARDTGLASVGYSIVLSSVCVVFGGLLLRIVIIVAGQSAGI